MKYPLLVLILMSFGVALSAQDVEPATEEPAASAATGDINDLIAQFRRDASWRPAITTRLYYEAEQEDFEYWESFVSARFTLPDVANSISNTLTFSVERADIDTPSHVDLPGELYVLGVNYAWIRPINDTWSVRLNLNPRFASDFDNTSGDAWHVRGAAMAVYRPNSRLMVGLGLFLTGRDDIPVVAGPGVIWRPKRYLELNLFFPRPRVNFLVMQNRQKEGWFYVGADWDNEQWAYERANGSNDEVRYHKLKAAIGFEHGPRGGLMGRAKPGLRWHVEAGYVFDRELEFEDVPDFKIEDTVYMQAGFSF